MLDITISSHISPSKNSKTKTKICKFFLKGQCKYGKSGTNGGICDYKHIDSHIQDRIGTGICKRAYPKGYESKAGYCSPTRKGITKRLQRDTLHQVKQWITSEAAFRR